jgi:cation diffusion facilitator family transporter
MLAWITLRAARDGTSQGLRALARDNASDAMAGVLVILGIAGAKSGLTWSEPAAAVAIGLLIVILGLRSARDGFDVLMDRVPDPTLRERLTGLAAGVDQVRGVQRVRVHPMGTNHWVDLEISVDGRLTVEEGHRIAHAVEQALVQSNLHVKGVQVHVNPWPAPVTPAEG